MIAGYDPTSNTGGAVFDERIADAVVEFFGGLRHVKGERGGEPFVLEPWQREIVRNLFGWVREDGTRRYRRCYIEVPRKNGKTTLLAGIMLYLLFADGEAGPEVYCAACDREQASLVFNTAAAMIAKSTALQSACRVLTTVRRIVYRDGFLRAIPANEGGSHGFNASGICCDELHAWPSRGFYDVLQTSTAARLQPLSVDITTAGFDRNSVCWQQHEYAEGVRDGRIDDPTMLPAIWSVPDDADWTDHDVWRAANPNLGVSIPMSYLERECQRAQDERSYENAFRRLHLNQWTSQKTRWLSIAHWRSCPSLGEMPDAGEVYGGLDLSSTTDLTSWCVVSRRDGGYVARWKFWIPEQRARELEKQDRVPYHQWRDEGYIEFTPGRDVDYGLVEAAIVEDAHRYKLTRLGYDPWNAKPLIRRLEDLHGLECVMVRQGTASMSAPCKEVERCVVAGTLDHGGNPIAEWMAEHANVRTDDNGNIKLDKSDLSTRQKIDGIVALALAVAVALGSPEKVRTGNVFFV